MAIYRVSVLQNLLGQRLINVYHYDTTTVLGGADGVELADAIEDAYVDSDLEDTMSDEWAYAGIELRRVDLADQPSLEIAPTGGAHAGLNVNEVLPLQVCLLVSGTALSTFPRRVRTYLGGFCETHVTNGVWVAGVLSNAVAFIGEMDTLQITAGELDRVSVRYTDPGSGPIVTSFNRVLTYTTTSVPATQRRRRIGVGI